MFVVYRLNFFGNKVIDRIRVESYENLEDAEKRCKSAMENIKNGTHPDILGKPENVSYTIVME